MNYSDKLDGYIETKNRRWKKNVWWIWTNRIRKEGQQD